MMSLNNFVSAFCLSVLLVVFVPLVSKEPLARVPDCPTGRLSVCMACGRGAAFGKLL